MGERVEAELAAQAARLSREDDASVDVSDRHYACDSCGGRLGMATRGPLCVNSSCPSKKPGHR